jgi:hypothetical protein
MDTRAFHPRTVPTPRRRRAAPAIAIGLLAAAALIGLYASGTLRLGPTSDGHSVPAMATVSMST